MLVNGSEIVGTDVKFLKAISFAKNIAVTKTPVLVAGEIGVGKRTLCRYIHDNSARGNKELIFVDCAQDIAKVENETLGYRDEDGRFHKGALERANGGTVAFINIESLEEKFQKKLYVIISELGDYDLDVRILATTTKNLSKYVGSGRFYRALYSIFSNAQLNIPAFRDRKDDHRAIIEYFVAEYVRKNNLPAVKINLDALEKIASYYWTQNYAELKMILENSINNCENGVLDREAIESGERKTENKLLDSDEDTFRLMSLKEAERLLIKKALIHTSENRTQAAKILGVSIRTLRNKINEYRGEGTTYFVNLR